MGVRQGRLAPCPASPNCVASQEPNPERRTPPFACSGPPDEAMARLRAIIKSMPRARIVKEEPDYLRAEFASRVFGFVDDLELWHDRKAGVIQVRSAARTGYWDLGVNRERVAQLRALFNHSAAN
ncbi:hypothetical protein AAU61_11495 [Desulfocarbo indianensis]|nr:hypothetical protein AAU61_11495 [Desulfocarbo indianensis]